MARRLPDGGLDPLAAARDRRAEARRRALHARRAARPTRARSTRSSACSPTRSTPPCSRPARPGSCAWSRTWRWATTTSTCAAAREHGIVVCNTPGVLDETTADLAFTLILAASRLAHDAGSRPARRRAGTAGGSRSISAKTCTARRSASSATAASGAPSRAAPTGFGMQVLHHARTDTGEPGYVADLDELLAASDIVSLHVPGGDATRHLVDARRLALDEADRGAREHRARAGGRRGRARRRAARRPAVRGRSRRVRTRARGASPAAERAAHGAAAAHRIGVAGDPHAHGPARGVGRRDRARRRRPRPTSSPA